MFWNRSILIVVSFCVAILVLGLKVKTLSYASCSTNIQTSPNFTEYLNCVFFLPRSGLISLLCIMLQVDTSLFLCEFFYFDMSIDSTPLNEMWELVASSRETTYKWTPDSLLWSFNVNYGVSCCHYLLYFYLLDKCTHLMHLQKRQHSAMKMRMRFALIKSLLASILYSKIFMLPNLIY